MKVKLRSEVDTNDQWDLTSIFESNESWNEEFEEVKKEVEKVTEFEGHIVESAQNLLSYLKWSDTKQRRLEKLYMYSHLKYDEDLSNAQYQTLYGKMDNLLTLDNELSAFVGPEMLKIDYQTIESFYEEEAELKVYKHALEDFYRYKEHTLSACEEKVLSTLSTTFNGADDIYEALNYTDLEYGMIENEKGEEVELTDSNYSIYVRSKDRKVRKMAFEKMYAAWSSMKHTVSNTFKTKVDTLTAIAKLRGYNSSLESSLFADHIDPQIYHTMIDTVHKHMPTIYKYFNLKKEILGLDEMNMYDVYATLIPQNDKKYSFDEGKILVTEALSVLGEDYRQNLEKAFTEKWIDIYPSKGKRGGAYSSGSYDTKPFLLLNFEGTLNDVSTLAHELGHSMHSFYSNQNNVYPVSDYRIFVAEVASTVNEVLLSHYLFKKTNDKKEKLAILNERMELFKATIYRQVMFAEFERDVHEKYEKGEVLTPEVLCKHYYKLNQTYFGDVVISDDEIQYEWERIPHFYMNFYVYKYAVGLSAACYIAKNILDGKEGALESYLSFLKLGGSMYPIPELKVAGVDVTSPAYIESAIQMFDETIDEFKVLYNE